MRDNKSVDKQLEGCPVTFAMKLLGGKWKPIIIYMLMNDISRFGQMHRSIDGISKQMLTKELRELEASGIIKRKVYPVVPPKVEYTITDKGKLTIPAIQALAEFGEASR